MKRHMLIAGLLLPACFARGASTWPVEGRAGLVQGQNPAKSAQENLRSLGGEAELSVAPVWWSEESPWRILPSWDFSYSGINNVLKVEEDLFLFAQQMTNRVDLGGAWRPDGDRRINGKIFYEAFNAKAAADEPWFRGLYDYQDTGLYVDWLRKWPTSVPMATTLGLKLTDRRYPHYVTLGEPELREKDSGIAKPYFSVDWAFERAVLKVDYSVQSVDYREAVVTDPDGTTASATKRRDMVQSLTLGLPYQGGSWDLFVEYALEARDSNYAVYDSSNNWYTSDYNDYADHAIRASWAWSFDDAWGFLKAPQVSVGAEASYRAYATRLAKDADGIVTPTKEASSVTGLSLGLNSPVAEHWSVYADLDVKVYRSNNLDEASGLNNYRFNTLRLGGQLAW